MVKRVHGGVEERGEKKDELRGSCFFAGTPTNVKARMASSGFSSLALSFPGRVPSAVLVRDPGVALAAV